MKKEFKTNEGVVSDYLDETKISSHTSQLTNLRHHRLEQEMDLVRVRVKESPTQENIIAYYGVLDAIFSYIGSLSDDKPRFAKKHIEDLDKNMKNLKETWYFLKYGAVGEFIRGLRQKYGKNFSLLRVEAEAIKLCDESSDKMRLVLQSMNYYFRIDKGSTKGLLADYQKMMKKKGGANEVLGQDED